MAGLISSALDDPQAMSAPRTTLPEDGQVRIPGTGTPSTGGTPKIQNPPAPAPAPATPGAPSPTPTPPPPSGGAVPVPPSPTAPPAPTTPGTPGAPAAPTPPPPPSFTLPPPVAGSGQAPAAQTYTPQTYTPAQTTAQTYTPTTGYDVTKWDPTQRSVNAATETVQGQLQGLLAAGNPLLERAGALSDERMAARGLINSSMATTAALDAILGQALNIATPDAAKYETAARDNQSVVNSAGQVNAQAATERARFGAQTTNEAGQFNTGQTNQVAQNNVAAVNNAGQFNAGSQNQASQFNAGQTNEIAVRERAAQLEQQRMREGASLDAARGNQTQQFARENMILNSQLDMGTKERMAAIEQNYKTLTTASQTANGLMQEMNARIGSILNDANIAAENKGGLINQTIENTRRTLQVLASINQVDYGDLLSIFGTAAVPNDVRPPTTPTDGGGGTDRFGRPVDPNDDATRGGGGA